MKPSTLRSSIVLFVLMTLSVIVMPFYSAIAAENPQDVRALPKGVSVYQLDNGMKVLLIENPALPMVGVNVVVKVGSAYETFSTSGMSHMLEHLLFNGTTTRTQKQLYDDVDRIGGYNNATTAEFYTNYMMVTPAENILKGMEIQADMLFHSTLPNDKFEKEKGIVLEEISKSLVDPQEQIERNTLSVLYRGHALSLPTLGTYTTIQGLSRDDVNAFYRNNYVPNNMILSVIGSFKTNEMLAHIKEIYGKASPGQVHHEADPDWATGFQVPRSFPVLDGEVYHRFYDGIDYVLQAFFRLPDSESPEYFQLLSVVLEKNKDPMLASLKKSSNQNVRSLKFSTRSSHLGTFVEATVILKSGAGIDSVAQALVSNVAAVSFALPAETVLAEATKARTEFARNIEKPHMFGIYNSDNLAKSGIEAVLASYTGSTYAVAAKDLAGFKPARNPLLLVQSPSPKKDTSTVGGIASAKRFSNASTGKNLIVVQNESSRLLAIHYLVKHKAAYEAKYGQDAAKILHECLDQRLKSDVNQKASVKFGLAYTVNDNPFIPMDDIYLHPDFGYIRVEGLADDIPGAISFLNSQMKDFVPTEEEFKKAVEKFKGIGAMLMGGDKAKKAFDEAYKGLVYEPELYTSSAVPLTYDKLVAFSKEYFKPSNMIISVVSPADPATIDALFDELGFSAVADEPAVYTPTFKSQTSPVTIDKAGNGQRSYLFWGFVATIDPSDAPALQALSLVLSDNIVFDIREKQGMAYGMSAGIEVIKDKALFFISQGTRPQNVDKLVPQYPGFFKMKGIDTLTQDGLQKSINMYLGRMMFRRLSSINQAYYLGNSLYFFNDYGYDAQFLNRLKTVSLADVRSAAKKYMRIANPLLIVIR